MRIGPDDVRVNQRGALALAAPGRRFGQRLRRGREIAAVHLPPQKMRKPFQQPRDVAAGGLFLDRNRDRVVVVLDQEQQRKPIQAGDVHGLPEFAFAGGALAGGDQRHFVALRVQVAGRVGASHRLEELRAGGRGAGDDVEIARAPVGRHLAAAGSRVCSGAHRGEQHILRGDAQHETQRTVAVVEIEPVVSRPEDGARGRPQRLVPRPADLEEDPALTLEENLAVVQTPRGEHDPEGV